MDKWLFTLIIDGEMSANTLTLRSVPRTGEFIDFTSFIGGTLKRYIVKAVIYDARGDIDYYEYSAMLELEEVQSVG